MAALILLVLLAAAPTWHYKNTTTILDSHDVQVGYIKTWYAKDDGTCRDGRSWLEKQEIHLGGEVKVKVECTWHMWGYPEAVRWETIGR